MPLGSTFAADLLNLSLCAKPIANIADNAAAAPSTVTWQALHTADPSSGTQGTAEVTLAGYTRTSVTRSTTGFSVTQGSSYAGASPVANIDFPNLTSTSTGVATHWSVGLSSASTAAITGVGASTVSAMFVASAAGTLTGVGAAVAASAFSSVAVASAQAVGASVVAVPFSMSAVATVVGVGAAVNSADAFAAGWLDAVMVGTNAGGGGVIVSADGLAVGTVDMVGVGSATSAADGLIQATGSAFGVGAALAAADGIIVGTLDMIGVGENATPAPAPAPAPAVFSEGGGGGGGFTGNTWRDQAARREKQLRQDDQDLADIGAILVAAMNKPGVLPWRR